ncbi:hypothetical protein DL765_009889 [Monosporascus sp. GIB2]|nr:hypothetical protein DL765_009889 [Monosporascus sp. GIB2]
MPAGEGHRDLDDDGVLIKPIRMRVISGRFVPEGPYVDMMAICDTLMFAVLMFPKRTEEPEQYSCFPLPTEPFFTTEPKETLGIQMATQGLGLHPVKGDAAIVSLGETKPLVVTSTRNTEDTVSIMKEWAESGA